MNEIDLRIEYIARECHESNRKYCLMIGDASQPRWEGAPDWQKDSARNGVRAHLEAPLTSPVTPQRSHELWMAQKREEGWVYGPVKDPAKKEHPCMVEYSALPLEQRTKDILFGTVVKVLSVIPPGVLAALELER